MSVKKRIFNFFCFFIIAPIIAFYSFISVLEEIKPLINTSKHFNPLEHGARPVQSKSKWAQYEVQPQQKPPSEQQQNPSMSKNSFWEEYDKETEQHIGGYEIPVQKQSEYYSWIYKAKYFAGAVAVVIGKLIITTSPIWLWLILSYRYLVKLFD
jgi:hypothetical protein